MRHGEQQRFFLILSASGGAGHIRAGDALLQAASHSDLPIRAEHYDCLDFTSRAFKKLYAESYLAMVNRIPELWGYFYSKSERRPYKKGVLSLFDHFNYRRYLKTLRALKPAAVLCTHFLPYVSISEKICADGMDIPFFAVTTDFDVHQLWVDPSVRRYFVHHNESAWQLHAKGIPRDRFTVAGIPIMSEFGKRRSVLRSRRRMDIPSRNFTVLLLSGGFGVGRIERILDSVVDTLGSFAQASFNLIIVCGKNEKLRSNLGGRRFPTNIRPKLFGFVDNIHDLMDASDVLVSKSGGLTSAEAMAKRLPMIIVDPIPGQEARNADIIVEHGAGFRAFDLPNLGYKLRRMLETPELLERARTATRELAKPHAAESILTDIVQSLTPDHRLKGRKYEDPYQ